MSARNQSVKLSEETKARLRPVADELILRGEWRNGGAMASITIEDPELARFTQSRIASLASGQVPALHGTELSIKANWLKSVRDTLSRQTQRT